jgi:hypothetical protein
MISAACRDLLADSQRFSATFGGGMFNHLPMALLALDRLGADEARLRAFAAVYSRQLRPKSARETETAAGFSRDLRERGRDALLGEVVPRLAEGTGSEAFHGLIRLAYAVDSGDDVDVPDALAAWTLGFSALPDVSEVEPFATFAEAYAAIAADESLPRSFEGRSISGRIAKVVALPAFRTHRGGVANVDLREMAMISAQVFASTGDFTALHMVTGCHAMRVLRPFLPPRAFSNFATAVLAAYVTIGRPPIAELSTRALPDEAALAARTVASDDDHDLKLVYSCLREEAEYGSQLHRLAAAVRLGFVRG